MAFTNLYGALDITGGIFLIVDIYLFMLQLTLRVALIDVIIMVCASTFLLDTNVIALLDSKESTVKKVNKQE